MIRSLKQLQPKIRNVAWLALAWTLLNPSAQAMIFPLNNLSREDRISQVADMTPEKFRALAQKFNQLFAPVVAQHGAILQIRLRWEDPTVNAYAFREGNVGGKPLWQIQMFGGLARRPEITEDGFTLVMCHELGHHLAGYPFKTDDNDEIRWAATEGESDYFAAQVCAKKIWASDTALNAQLAIGVSDEVRFACRWNYPGSNARAIADQNLCYRTINAGLSLATLLARLNDYLDPMMRTRNREWVDQTYEGHPQAQCRLDTYAAGALCATPFDLRVIPGIMGSTAENSVRAEAMAMHYSCRQESRYDPRYAARYGARPLCWFRPLVPPQSRR